MEFRSPQFGTTLKIDTYVTTRYTDGGQLVQFRKKIATSQKLKFVFNGLNQNHVDALVLFLSENAAKQIFMTDENNITRYGFVTSDKIRFKVQTYSLGADGNPCPTYMTDFEFEEIPDVTL